MQKTRVVIYLDEAERAALQKLKINTGASIAELCRRAIASWLKLGNVLDDLLDEREGNHKTKNNKR
jgi:hypothetical protein